MKSLYYRTQRISSRSLVVLVIVSLATIAIVEAWPKQNSERIRDVMVSAAYQTESAFDSVHCRRIGLGHRILPNIDPAETGMLGPSMSLVTTLPGHLDAKQTSVNPNFAAVAVKYLTDIGAKPGDRVAIGCTGSFPALNVAVIAAAEQLQLETVLISSAASSQFGANHPEWMWPDIEQSLFDEGVIHTRSIVTSRGGFLDKAAGMTRETKHLLDAALTRSGTPVMESDSIENAISGRVNRFTEQSGCSTLGEGYVAYVNVGGGAASVGGTEGNDQLGSGTIYPKELQGIDEPIDSVAVRFLASGVPVINMINVVHVAGKHGLEIAPTNRPVVGQADVYASRRYRKPLAFAGILLIIIATSLIVRPPIWLNQTLRQFGFARSSDDEPQWMV